MCGRYYIDDDTAKETEKLVRQAEAKLHSASAAAIRRIGSADIHPSEEAPVLLADGGGIACVWLRWGFPMAGCCRHYSDGEHFIILTTDANSSMQPIHNRMPLLLEETEVRDWILNSDRTDSLLRKIPPLLDCGTDFEQMSFF